MYEKKKYLDKCLTVRTIKSYFHHQEIIVVYILNDCFTCFNNDIFSNIYKPSYTIIYINNLHIYINWDYFISLWIYLSIMKMLCFSWFLRIKITLTWLIYFLFVMTLSRIVSLLLHLLIVSSTRAGQSVFIENLLYTKCYTKYFHKFNIILSG